MSSPPNLRAVYAAPIIVAASARVRGKRAQVVQIGPRENPLRRLKISQELTARLVAVAAMVPTAPAIKNWTYRSIRAKTDMLMWERRGGLPVAAEGTKVEVQ